MTKRKEIIRQLPKTKYLSLREFEVGSVLRITEILKKDQNGK